MKRAVVSDSVHIPSMMYCVRVFFMFIYHILEISGFFTVLLLLLLLLLLSLLSLLLNIFTNLKL